MDSSNRVDDLVRLIPDWLALTRDADIPLGISRGEALRRASELRRLLREGTAPPATSIAPDEDFKDVLDALVFLLSESAASKEVGLLEEADSAYQLIRRIQWEEDDFYERQALLRRCSDIGWQCAESRVLRTDCRRPTTDPDGLWSTCKRIQETADSNPRLAVEEASELHDRLRERPACGVFDERDFFLGETALRSAGALRLLGRREETEEWLRRAEACFQRTLNPEPPLAKASYVRLALLYEKRQLQDVLSQLPKLLENFQGFDMPSWLSKTKHLEALCLKALGRTAEASKKFTQLANALDHVTDAGLLGLIYLELGQCNAAQGHSEVAISFYGKAMSLLSEAKRFYGVAQVKAAMGEMLRSRGALAAAAEAFRESVETYSQVGMVGYTAYIRIILADTLLALGRNREAEHEILAALPTIEEHKMVPEGFAAFALLRESVCRRQADPNALRELREQLRQLHD